MSKVVEELCFTGYLRLKKIHLLSKHQYRSQVELTKLDGKQLQQLPTSLVITDLCYIIFFPEGAWILTISILLSWLYERQGFWCHASVSVHYHFCILSPSSLLQVLWHSYIFFCISVSYVMGKQSYHCQILWVRAVLFWTAWPSAANLKND